MGLLSLLPNNFAGSRDGSFFKTPVWVDLKLAPGFTDQLPYLQQFKLFGFPLTDLLTGKTIYASPVFPWLLITVLVYVVFPYDFEEGKNMNMQWIFHRFLINLAINFLYYGFWHGVLYFLEWGKRPFKPNRKYRYSKLIHNVFYWTLGVFQYSVWEAMFVYCYATGRLPYMSDAEAFGTLKGFANLVVSVILVPLFHELHFYFAHRLIHIKPLYKFVHAVHHRNTDIEPFAGLSMHPIEHLYYYTSVAPSLYLYLSPFAFHFHIMLCILAPGASHSGFEDHYQSDQVHYLHHRFFECNYGTTTILLDRAFGTFRESLEPKSKAYRGEHVEKKDNKVKLNDKAAEVADSKATLLGLPTWDEALFNLVTCVLLPCLVYVAYFHPSPINMKPRQIAAAMAFGPVVFGFLLLAFKTKQFFGKIRRNTLYPFHKDNFLGQLGFHVIVGMCLGVLPAYHLIEMLLSAPGEGAYFQIRSIIASIDK